MTGAVFVMWLGEQITEKGIGNGMSLIIFFGIIERSREAVPDLRALADRGHRHLRDPDFSRSWFVIAGVVVMTMAMRKIPIQIPRKVVGRNRIRQGQKTHLPLRVNSAGVMPIIFAQSIMFVPPTIATFFPNVPWVRDRAHLQPSARSGTSSSSPR